MKAGKAKVLNNQELAGFLTKDAEGFTFAYEDRYYRDPGKPAISLSFPKTRKDFHSKQLFPFFFGLLSEGENKNIQCRTLKIDENDHFTRLIKTAHTETIGAVTIQETDENP